MNDLDRRIRAVANGVSWTYHSRVSAKFKYVTVAVPKVGCSTIKRALHVLEGFEPAERLALEHGAGESMRLSRLSAKEARTALTDPSWVRFTFVRNPYERMLSAWKSKVLSAHDTQYVALRQRIRDAFNYPSGGRDDSPVVAFGDFVRFITTTDDRSITDDGHWERQTVVGLHDLISYDVVCRFETFADDFRAVLTRLSAPEEVVALANEVTNSTEPLPLAAAYDSELAALVYDYYRADFDAFAYDRDSWLSR